MNVSYYDAILASIGLLLVTGGVVATVTTPVAVTAFAVAAMVLVAHALFMSPLAETQRATDAPATAGQQ